MSRAPALTALIYAFAASLGGSVVFHALAPLLGMPLALRLVLSALALAALLVLFLQVGRRSGRSLLLLAWLGLSAALFGLGAPAWFWALCYTGLLWMAHALYRSASLSGAVAQGLLFAFALCAAVVAARHSNSLFLAIWSFHLVLALPALWPSTPAPVGASESRFDEAWRSAEAALRAFGRRAPL